MIVESSFAQIELIRQLNFFTLYIKNNQVIRIIFRIQPMVTLIKHLYIKVIIEIYNPLERGL